MSPRGQGACLGWVSPSRERLPMAASGHEDPFPPLWLNVRCVIRHGTFAETNGNGRDAPIPAVGLPPGPPGPSQRGLGRCEKWAERELNLILPNSARPISPNRER